MTPQLTRVVAGFLLAFVLLSLAPQLPGLVTTLRDPALAAVVEQMWWLAAVGAAVGVVAIAAVRRRAQRSSARAPRRPDTARGPAPRRSDAPSALSQQIRDAARRGGSVPDLARRFRLSQDAIRAAVRGDRSGAAGPRGTSFRSRQEPLPARPSPKALPSRRTPYTAGV
jgi:hypothetical protein